LPEPDPTLALKNWNNKKKVEIVLNFFKFAGKLLQFFHGNKSKGMKK